MGGPFLAPALEAHKRRRQWARLRALTAGAVLVLVLLVAFGALVQGLLREPATGGALDPVAALDTDGDGVPDIVENAQGTDPRQRRPASLLPEWWVERHRLDVSDPDLANRTAARPTQAPAIYGPQGLPAEFRMTLYEVYSYAMPADWDETTQGPYDSRLDPHRADVAGSGVPYAWLIRMGLDPFDVAGLDVVAPGARVPWTPREAYERGLHPLSPDGDEDGLLDVEEERLGTSPRLFSTTGSGIADGWLVAHGFDPLDPALAYDDLDRDGLTNLAEFEASHRLHPELTLRGGGLDPRKASTLGGPVPDGWLVLHGLDPMEGGIAEKVTERQTLPARDGTIAAREMRVVDEYRVGRPPLWDEARNGPWMGGSDPASNDTDADGLTDLEEITGREIRKTTGPKWVVSDPTARDTDRDGLSDGEEHAGRVGDLSFNPTDPSAPDTDVDGLLDGEELGIVLWQGVRLPPLNPTSDDTDADGFLDGAEVAYWLRRSEEAAAGLAYPWGPPVDRPRVAAALASPSLPEGAVAEALLPGGDMDRDGLANALDPDSDGDGLLDGWEAKPELYLSSPFAAPQARPATDPANADTDLDTLPDRWEIRYGIFDDKLAAWNLDPSQWSSLRDGRSDAEADLDGDSATWYAYLDGPTGRRTVANVFVATNRVEFEEDSDPNRKATSLDGIPDGWKIFWGKTYFSIPSGEVGAIYPGAPGDLVPPADRPIPRIGNPDEVALGKTTVTRVRIVDGSSLRAEDCRGSIFEVQGASGVPVKLCRVQEEVPYDYRSAARNGTNPYLDDTDGDGVPDAWETAWSALGSGRARVSAVDPDASGDLDEDGLDNAGEFRAGSSPYLPDSDLGGAGDDVEARLGLDPFDPTDDGRGLDTNLDSDGDFVPDVTEVIGRLDENARRIRTDPHDPDTDRDGLLDGPSLSSRSALNRPLRRDNPADAARLAALEARGLIVVEFENGDLDVLGEASQGSDPTALSTSGDGVPDGWARVYGGWTSPKESTGLLTTYSYGRPSWWNESQHGVWRWGLKPGQVADSDHDDDGLDDRNGEDPIPFANNRNALPLGDPREEGIAPLERLLRAQAYGNLSALPDALPRVKPRVLLDPAPDLLATNGSAYLTGNVTVGDWLPVRNATVVLSLQTRDVVLGAALTNDTGAFNVTVVLGSRVLAPEGSEGVPVFGRVDGTGVHVNEEAALKRVDVGTGARVFAWTYNESFHPPPRQARGLVLDGEEVGGMLSNASEARVVNLTLGTSLSLEAASSLAVGSAGNVTARLLDALARPVAGATVRFEPPGVNLTTDANGRAVLDVTVPSLVGDLAYNATFEGAHRLTGSRADLVLRVTETTTLTLFPPPLAVRPNETFAFTGLLRTARGVPVAEATVTVRGPGADLTLTTDAKGAFGALVTLPPDAPLGGLSLRGAYAGNATLVGSNATVEMVSEGSPRWETNPASGPLDGRANVTARLLHVRGGPLAGKDVLLRLPDGRVLEKRTDAQGRAGFAVDLVGARPGGLVAILAFSDPVEGDAHAPVPITVTTTTQLALRAEEPTRGRDAALTGHLLDAAGQPVAGQPVVVRLGPATQRRVTDDQGIFAAAFPTAALRAGPLVASASYEGSPDGVYAGSQTSLPLVLRDEPVLTLDAGFALVTRPVLEGRLATLLGEPLPNRELNVRTEDGETQALTDLDGRFQARLSSLSTRALGPVALAWSLEGDGVLRPLERNLTILVKDSGTLRAEIPTALLRGATARVPFTVLDSRERPVADARLAILLDGVPLEVSHSSGAAVFAIPRDATPGPHKLRVDVLSDVIAVPNRTLDLNVQRDTRLTLLSAPQLVPGATGEAIVLLESAGEPLAGETLLVQGGDVPIEVTTGPDGRARIPITSATTERALYQVGFSGKGENGPAALALQVRSAAAPDTASTGLGLAPWLLLGLLAAVLVAFLLLRRRAQDPAQVLRRASRKLRSAHPDVGALYEAYLTLLGLAGMSEESTESATFGVVLKRFLDEGDLEAETSLLSEVFNRAVYAPAMLDPGSVQAAGDALERIAARMHAPDAGPAAGAAG